MRSLCLVFFTIFLSTSQVEVYSQTFPYVSFMGRTLANHSYVDLSLVGRPDIPPLSDGHGYSVECHTDLTKYKSVAKGFANPVARDTHISPMHKQPYHFTLYQLQCFMLTARMTSSIAASTALKKLASLILLKLSPLCYRHSNTCSRIPALVSIRV